MTQLGNPYPLFSQPWWLDTVAPKQWDEVVIEKGGLVAARLPYVYHKKRFGLVAIHMPKLTQTLGPWLRPYTGKYTNRLSEEKELMTELIARLPPFVSFVQNFHYSITNWLPFYWQGFQQTTRYTYVLEDLTNMEALWTGIRENVRTDIRKAQRTVDIRDDLPLKDFLILNEKVFSRQGRGLPYPPSLVERLDCECQDRNCRKIFYAQDARKRLHAAVYVVWDRHSAYYLMGGSDPELRNSGATSLCMWEAIKFASTVTRKFDFEGSMIEPVERFFRAFGARQIPFFQIRKINSRLTKIKNDIRSWIS